MSRLAALFNRQPIARKLAWLIGGVATLAVTFLSLAVMGYEWVDYHDAKLEQLATIADIVGANSKGALLFGDSKRATETLTAFGTISSVTQAAIYDKSGVWFAGYRRDPRAAASDPAAAGPNSLMVERPILVDDEKVGAIRVISENIEIYSDFRSYLLLLGSILTAVLSLAFGLTARLQRLISKPLLDLAGAARALANRDYSVRAVKHSDDEIGALTDSFNLMVQEVRSRTQSLLTMNAELAEARRKADTAAHVKSQFLANMSHEIRTPMNGILGMTELALDTAQNHEQQEYLRTVHHSAESLLELLDSILDLSKIEAGKLVLERTPFDVSQLLDDLHRLFALKAHQKGLELLWDVDPAMPPVVEGDPTRLRQVLANLIGNAIKFTDRGEIVTTLKPIPGSSDIVEWSVRDTGIGIAPEQRDRIFDPFIQADESTTRKFGGSGLGLAICQRLTELMGGAIWVESVPGAGSTFRFTVRLSAADSAVYPVLPPLDGFAGKEVLVVDDNEVNRRLLHDQLERAGLRATLAAGALEALEIVRSRGEASPFPLILTDVCMPVMDGFEFAQKLRGMGLAGSSVIVMITSIDIAGGNARCRELGIARYLIKPVSRRALLETVASVLSAPAAPAAGTAAPASATHVTRGLSILVAEDNIVNQKVIQTLLARAGHEVTLVGDGAAAVAAVHARRFDVVFMDVQMPVMDGLTAVGQIRRNERERDLPHTPIVALTAHALAEDANRCLAAGMDFYVSKPLRSQKLWEVIEKAVAGAAECEPGLALPSR